MTEDNRTKRDGLVLWFGGARGAYQGDAEAFYQGLWFTLMRSRWTSLALIPSEEGETTAGIATRLSGIGRRLSSVPVTFLVMAGAMDYASAGKFVATVAGKSVAPSDELPSSRVIVAVPSVLSDPLALSVTEAADAVALCVRIGTSHIRAAERTIELVGRAKFLGCVAR